MRRVRVTQQHLASGLAAPAPAAAGAANQQILKGIKVGALYEGGAE